MRCSVWVATWGSLALLGYAGQAAAQYGVAPSPPVPGYGVPGPALGYPPPGYGERPFRRRFGRRCDAFLPSAYGPRREFCLLIRPRPRGEPCHCPPPANYGPGPWLQGRVVR
jgi:hypothetical protein